MSMRSYRRLPVMSRSEAMEAGDALRAACLPEGHGEATSGSTSGSTGRSLQYWKSAVFRKLELAYHLHHYQNMGWDFSLDLASILVDKERVAPPPKGRTYPDWGPCVQGVYATGAHHFLSARADILEQLAWLQARRPAYLQTYPSNLAALLDVAAREGVDLSFIRGVTTQGEQVSAALRAEVAEFFAWPLHDVYSASELSYLAVQCPSHEHYHVQTGNVVLEVLDEVGNPCAPGEIGRVVATCLTNFAAPLLRYALGDYAEVGEPCDCGRAQPVLRRIVGRSRNMFRRPDGKVVWPHFGTAALHQVVPIRQFQVRQTALDRIELHVVCDDSLSKSEESQLVAILQRELEYPVEVEVLRCARIERSEGGKYEDFVSEL